MLHKLVKFAGADSGARLRMLRSKAQRAAGVVATAFAGENGPAFLSYRPDSAWIEKHHPEFQLLARKWLKHNRVTNAGDMGRFYALILNLKQVIAEGVQGDFAELGVYKGNSAAVLAHFADGAGRTAFFFDTFSGFDRGDLVGTDSKRAVAFADTSLAAVQSLVGYAGSCTYIKGLFPASLTPEVQDRRFAFVHLDCDLYKPMSAALSFFYPRLSPGGVLAVHDYSSGQWPGATQAVNEFTSTTGMPFVLLADKSGTAVLRKPLTTASGNPPL